MDARQPASLNDANLEIEVKLKVRNMGKLLRQVRDLGFLETGSRSLEDNWVFDYPKQTLAKTDSLLRLRQYSGSALLTFKGPKLRSRHFKIREEFETVVSNPKAVHRMLVRLGFKLTFRYQKFRSIFKKDETPESGTLTLTLDETPIGNYVEIEGAQADIDNMAQQLGYSRSAYITDSYLQLFLRKVPRPHKSAMTFSRRHEKNP